MTRDPNTDDDILNSDSKGLAEKLPKDVDHQQSRCTLLRQIIKICCQVSTNQDLDNDFAKKEFNGGMQ